MNNTEGFCLEHNPLWNNVQFWNIYFFIGWCCFTEKKNINEKAFHLQTKVYFDGKIFNKGDCYRYGFSRRHCFSYINH